MEQAGQWPSSVAIDTHTLIGLGRGVDSINRLSEIQGVIKKFFLEMANCRTVNAPEVAW